MPEFMIYDESIILNVNRGELKYLEKNEKLLNEKEFIVSIKNYMNTDEMINQIIELLNCKDYQILLNGNNQTGNIIYKFIKY